MRQKTSRSAASIFSPFRAKPHLFAARSFAKLNPFNSRKGGPTVASSQVDVNRILSFRLKDVLRGNTFAGLLFAALGAFVLIVPPADQRDWEGVLAGGVVLAVGLSILIVPRLKVQRNEQIVAEISPAGVMMGIQNSTRQRFLVPWDEVIEITQISFTRRIVTTFATYFREPAITVSRDFFEREIDVEAKGRGPFWDHHVHMLQGDKGVRLALLHNEFNPTFSRWTPVRSQI